MRTELFYERVERMDLADEATGFLDEVMTSFGLAMKFFCVAGTLSGLVTMSFGVAWVRVDLGKYF